MSLAPRGDSGFNHVPGGANILFLDDHVQFEKYPGKKFPVTKGFALSQGGV